MANALYPLWKQELIQSSASVALNGSGTTGVYTSLIDTGSYTYSAAHQFYTSLSGEGGTAQEIGATKTYALGTFDGADITYTAVAGTVSYEALVLWIKNAGASSTYRLLCYLDTSITGMPVTSNGGNITVTWDAAGIFTI